MSEHQSEDPKVCWKTEVQQLPEGGMRITYYLEDGSKIISDMNEADALMFRDKMADIAEHMRKLGISGKPV